MMSSLHETQMKLTSFRNRNLPQGCKHFPEIYGPSQNSRSQKGSMQQDPDWEPTSNRLPYKIKWPGYLAERNFFLSLFYQTKEC